jgi:ferredoxin
MRVHVDMSRCETHAQCVFAAPEVFSLDEDDQLTYIAEADDRMREDLERAARACPVQAILLDGELP